MNDESVDEKADARVGATVVHRRYVAHSHGHYGGNLVDGAYVLGLFGDVATELCIRTDGDEGLFASYDDVQFLAPVQAGDVIEAQATLVHVGTRSRVVQFEARVVCRATDSLDAASSTSAATVIEPAIVCTTARGTVVVPASH